MTFHNQEFNFFDEMDKNIEFYLLDSISSEKKELIKSRINNFKTTSDFFNYYSNTNIISLFESFDKLDTIFSTINNHKINFKSKVDQYISELSNIILSFSLISKNQTIIIKAITDSESHLKNFYLEYNISKDSQKQLDEYVDKLIDIKNGTKKKDFSDDNLFNKKQRNKIGKSKNQNILILNQKTEENSINFNCNLINIFPSINNNINNNTNEETSINNLLTPKFQNKIIEDNNNHYSQLNNIKENDINKNPVIKQESIQSYYTLASKNNQEEKMISTLDDEKKEKTKDDLNMSNFLNDSEVQLVYCKSNASDKMNDNETEESETKNFFTKKTPTKQIFSCMNLKSKMEKSMFKDILGIINNLYKNGEINNDEKVQLKKLIITKSDKISKLYKSYNIDDLKFINELKKLIV